MATGSGGQAQWSRIGFHAVRLPIARACWSYLQSLGHTVGTRYESGSVAYALHALFGSAKCQSAEILIVKSIHVNREVVIITFVIEKNAINYNYSFLITIVNESFDNDAVI